MGKQNFDRPAQKFARSWVSRTKPLGSCAAPSPEKPGGKDSCVVEDDQVIRPQERGEVAESAVMYVWLVAIQVKQTRVLPVCERLLSDEFFRQDVIEIGEQHASDYRIFNCYCFTNAAYRSSG